MVSRLRKALSEGSVEGQADGYRLRVEPDAIDAVRFERLVGQARTEEGPRRVRLLREALALWRGAAMQDIGLQESAAFDAAVTRLEGLRLTATEDRFDAEISLGHGMELITELTDLVAARPVRERCCADACPCRDRSRQRGAASCTSARGKPWPTRWASTPRRSCPHCTSACCGASWDDGRKPEDQLAHRADQLRRQGR